MKLIKQRVEELQPELSIVWEPKKGEEYFYVAGNGQVCGRHWDNYLIDHYRLKHHNIYKTQGQAEQAARYQQRYNMVLQAVLNLEPDQVVDWSDVDKLKYIVSFNHERGIWGYGCLCGIEQGYPPLTDKKNVQPLLDYLKDFDGWVHTATDGWTWRPLKGGEPNWFWRKMQYVILGNNWVKDPTKEKRSRANE